MKPHPTLVAALVVAASVSAHAGSFTQNFNAIGNNNVNGAVSTHLNLVGTTNAAGQLISSRKDTNNTGTINVAIVKSPVSATQPAAALRLAEKGTGSAVAAYILPVMDAGVAIQEFTVSLDLLMDKTSAAVVPADGFNISFGTTLSGVGGGTGHSTAYGLVVNFDTFSNTAADPRSIEVFSDAVSVGNFLATDLPGANFTYDQTFRHIDLHWDANGLDLTYAGQVIYNNLPTPGFVPAVGGNFAFNAATGGLNQDVFIDNLTITTVPYAVPPPVATADVVIEEIMADNASGKEDEDLDQPDWIDLYNGTAGAVNVGGWTLDYTSVAIPAPGVTPPPATWTLPSISIPAFSHKLVFASGKNKFTNVRPHTNFQLTKEGGTLTLTKGDGTTVASTLSYGQQREDISFGRLGPDPSSTLGFFATPTPEINNAGLQAANFTAPGPVFFKPGVTPEADQPDAVISAATSIGIRLPDNAPPGAYIRYTLNTAEPSDTAGFLYTAPVSITASTPLKAKVFAPGWLPSKNGNRSFIWLSSAADTNATTLINVATNYNASGQPFSSNLPVIVLDSYLRNVDALTAVTGLRPYRFTQAAVYDVKPGMNRASFANVPDQVLRAATHVRGQSSAGQTQRPYALEFWKSDEDIDTDHPLLGMPSHSDWVLMSLTLDKSLMRNYIMQQAMLEANGPGAGVRCRYVEVFFNQGNNTLDYADYRGVYLLMEKVSRGKERVNVAKLNDSMSDPSLVNGGFIFKNDKTPYEYKINGNSVAAIPGSSRDYDIYDPEPVTAVQAGALKTALDQMTSALAAADYNAPASANYYGKWLNERSFIDKTLWYEFCKEVDAYVFSNYWSKDRNGLITGFPFWDVDRSLGNSNYGSSNATFGLKWWTAGSNYTYYTRLDDDAEFNDRYWNRWTALRRSLFANDYLFNRIESVYSLLADGSTADIVNTSNTTTMAIQVPAARHYRKYATLGVNTFTGGQTGQVDRNTWRKEVDAMKTWIAERLEWMDSAPQTTSTTALAARLKPTEVINAATGLPQYGGNVPVGYEFRLDNPNTAGGTVYYTIDGPDPRQTGGVLDGAALTATTRTVTSSSVLANAQTWKWLLPTAAPANDANGASWTAAAYIDTAWSSGAAPLGYGETTGLTTNISPTAPNYTSAINAAGTGEPGAAYFRTTFTASGTSSLTGAMFEIIADDGAVIYLNGVEVGRFNYPLAPTAAAFGQEALGPIDPGNNFTPIETTFFQVPFDRTKLKDGVNTLAVEVHQALYSFPPNSTNPYPRNDFSDLRFDVKITGLTTSGPGGSYAITSPGTHVLRTRINNGATWSPLTEATFIADAVAPAPATLVVSELMYHPSDPTPAELLAGFNKENDFEFIELLNTGIQALDLSTVVISGAVDFNFNTARPTSRYLAPGGRVLIVENEAAFLSRAGAGPFNIAGSFLGNLSNNSETIVIKAGAVEVRNFTYQDSPPWPKAADGDGFSLVLDHPFTVPDHSLGQNWRAGVILGGTPGTGADWVAGPDTVVYDTDTNDSGLSAGVRDALGLANVGDYAISSAVAPYTPPGGAAANYLTLVFERNPNSAARITPELATDLADWSSAGLVYVSTVRNSPAKETVTWRSADPVSGTKVREFARLRVQE